MPEKDGISDRVVLTAPTGPTPHVVITMWISNHLADGDIVPPHEPPGGPANIVGTAEIHGPEDGDRGLMMEPRTMQSPAWWMAQERAKALEWVSGALTRRASKEASSIALM